MRLLRFYNSCILHAGRGHFEKFFSYTPVALVRIEKKVPDLPGANRIYKSGTTFGWTALHPGDTLPGANRWRVSMLVLR